MCGICVKVPMTVLWSFSVGSSALESRKSEVLHRILTSLCLPSIKYWCCQLTFKSCFNNALCIVSFINTFSTVRIELHHRITYYRLWPKKFSLLSPEQPSRRYSFEREWSRELQLLLVLCMLNFVSICFNKTTSLWLWWQHCKTRLWRNRALVCTRTTDQKKGAISAPLRRPELNT